MDEQREGMLRSTKKVRAVRGQWTAAQRAEMVAESLIAGASVQSVAARRGIRAALLSKWRRQARAKSANRSDKSVAQFAAVRVEAAADGMIEIDLANGCVRIRGVVSGGMLRSDVVSLRWLGLFGQNSVFDKWIVLPLG